LKIYRELIEKELDKGICWCCENLFSKLCVHHMNGKHKDDSMNNLICVCERCHGFIHRGFKKRVRLTEKNIERILLVRNILIKKTYKNNTLDFLNYERAVALNVFTNKKRCYHCGNTKNIKIIAPKFILKFDKKNSKGIGLPLCKKCLNQ